MEILFTHYPLGSINFFRKVIRFGFIGGFVMAVPAIYILLTTWSAPTFCDRVLRIYHILRLLIFFIQVPLRLVMSSQLSHASRGVDRASVVDRLIGLCHSWAWKLNQITGVIVYWMFAFAAVFTWKAQHCSSVSSSLYRLCIINVIIFFIHMLLSLNWLRLIVQEDSFEAAMWKRGATHDIIETYTTKMVYGQEMMGDKEKDSDSEIEKKEGTSTTTSTNPSPPSSPLPFQQTECSICMCDYVAGQSIRVLPCSHNYHQSCIDEWLYKKKACPLCSREIDNMAAFSLSPASGPAAAPAFHTPPMRALPQHLHPHHD